MVEMVAWRAGGPWFDPGREEIMVACKLLNIYLYIQVCNVMSNSEHFHSNIDSREYRINYSFNCDSSNVVYLLECTVCGVQYVGSTCTPFKA